MSLSIQGLVLMEKTLKAQPNLFRKRLKAFSGVKRARFSLYFLAILFVFSLFGSVICNSKPLLVLRDGKIMLPFLFVYSELEFGGDFETEADYGDLEFQEILNGNTQYVIWAPIRFGPTDIDFNLGQPAPSPPDLKHILGTDDRGRDVFARLVFGFRLSLIFGLFLATLGTLIGIVAGAIQGYFGGFVDLIGQRITEIWSSIPELFILIILTSLFSPSIYLMLVLMSLMGWMGLAAYVRGEFLKAREYEYVQSPVALGASKVRVMAIHILPNTLAPIITFFPFRVSAAITGLASLDFLGLGVPSPTPSLGELLAQGKGNISSWWIILSTFIVMVLMILALNFIGEGVQKSFDPKAKLK